jgi:hypothetical protein
MDDVVTIESPGDAWMAGQADARDSEEHVARAEALLPPSKVVRMRWQTITTSSVFSNTPIRLHSQHTIPKHALCCLLKPTITSIHKPHLQNAKDQRTRHTTGAPAFRLRDRRATATRRGATAPLSRAAQPIRTPTTLPRRRRHTPHHIVHDALFLQPRVKSMGEGGD